MQVGVVVDPTAARIGRIGTSGVLRPRRARSACRNIAWVANPMHTAQAHDGALGPTINQRLAALVPIAFKAIDKAELRRNLRGKLASSSKARRCAGRSPSVTCTSQLASMLAGRVRWSVETMTRQLAASSGANVVLKRGMTVRERGVGVAIDQRASRHGSSFASSESASL